MARHYPNTCDFDNRVTARQLSCPTAAAGRTHRRVWDATNRVCISERASAAVKVAVAAFGVFGIPEGTKHGSFGREQQQSGH